MDLDVHQGNGNAVLFQGRPEVVTFSIQCEANYFSEKQTSDLDIELPVRCNDGTYLSTLNHWSNCIPREGNPFDLIFFQAGVDVLEADDRLGRMSLSADGVKRRNRLVYDFARKLNVPLVICMGGGCPRTDDWTPIFHAHANVYFGAHQYLARPAKDEK
jgi:acetoin utilization deacetylase AcuC-like enzyme